ncbi:MAG TPA: hypothetical protein VEA59_00440 [Patescibacteria group bacterium]|nr:hypothetical protein [Patescibacteria group bacterium]
MVPKELKQKAYDLRDAGHSYKFIEKELGINRSTLSGWFARRPFNPNHYTLEKIRNGPKISAQKRIKQRLEHTALLLEKARNELGDVSNRDLFMLGLGLYLGEGAKSYDHIKISNADPLIIKLAIKWFRSIFSLIDNNFSLRIHSYPDLDIKQVEQFWLSATNLPVRCLRRTIIDDRQKVLGKRGKLPYGTAHLTVLAAGNPDHGVTLARLIRGYMKAVTE